MNTKPIGAKRFMTLNSGWLDKAAVLMAAICGIHCLATPILIIALPIIGTTFWASESFHVWMLALVIPTTTLAVFSGCRKHKDRFVAVCAATGLLILASVTAMESFAAGAAEHADDVACVDCCPVDANTEGESRASLAFPPLSTEALLNLTGGLFLIAGHIRNFRLCRAARCCDGLDAIR